MGPLGVWATPVPCGGREPGCWKQAGHGIHVLCWLPGLLSLAALPPEWQPRSLLSGVTLAASRASGSNAGDGHLSCLWFVCQEFGEDTAGLASLPHDVWGQLYEKTPGLVVTQMLTTRIIWRLLHSQVWHLSCNDSKIWISQDPWPECPGVAPPCSSGSSQYGAGF